MTLNVEQVCLPEARSFQYFFYRQPWHFLFLLIFVPMAWVLASPAMGERFFLGFWARDIFWIGLSLVILHQIIVWIVFRLQLGWAVLTRIFGSYDLTFWGIVFLPLLAARPVFVLLLARATQDTLFVSRQTGIILGFIFLLPAIYTFWSVIKYFGVTRAMGGDHFRVFYREKGLVKKGIFRFTGNGMYAFGFFLLWAIALFHASQAALVLAIFQHAYVWVHYFCTEKPDMDLIYG